MRETSPSIFLIARPAVDTDAMDNLQIAGTRRRVLGLRMRRTSTRDQRHGEQTGLQRIFHGSFSYLLLRAALLGCCDHHIGFQVARLRI